jgi:thiamine biosynthesis protein ThiS
MLEIVVNGKPMRVSEPCTVTMLIEQLGLGGRYAVEVNKTIVPRSRHASEHLQPGDRIEIVQAIGGG